MTEEDKTIPPKTDGFQALLGIRKEEFTDNLCRGGLEAALEYTLNSVERATARVVAIRAIIFNFPELVQLEREYRAIRNNDYFYPANSKREFAPICGCCADTTLYEFKSQAEFEELMKKVISLRERYSSTQKKCYKWLADIHRVEKPTGGFDPSVAVEPQELKERLERAERIGSEATFVIPELVKFLDGDIKIYLQSANIKSFDTSKYEVEKICRPL